MQNSAEDSLTCGAWSPDGQHFYVGGTRGQFLECVSASLLPPYCQPHDVDFPLYRLWMALRLLVGRVFVSTLWLPTPHLAMYMQLTHTVEYADITSKTCPTTPCKITVGLVLPLLSPYLRIEEDHPIMSFTVSHNGRHALLNVASQVSMCVCVCC